MANEIPYSVLRTDILDPELLKERARVFASTHYSVIVSHAEVSRTTTPGLTKNIFEAMELIKDAIEHYEDRSHIVERERLRVVYEDPDIDVQYETISVALARREPGAYSQGAPFEGKIKNRRPILREEIEDEEEPGYKKAILGFFHDNVICLTCWANTNKAANKRMLWLEEVMEQYTYYITSSGVNRFLYENHGRPIVKETNNNRIFGRPINFFVRTEQIRIVRQKALEELYLRLALRSDENL